MFGQNITMENENYWQESKVNKFSFDDDENLSSQSFFKLGVEVAAGLKENASEDKNISFDVSKKCKLPLHAIISEKSLENILQAQSGLNASSKNRGDSEYYFPNVPITLKRLVVGRPCSLYHHKSLTAKTQLLDGAIAIGDGNAILAVVLFLVQTLKKKLVYQMLSSRPAAVSHYINYLMIRLKTHELVDLLVMLGQSREAAMKQFQLVVLSTGSSLDILYNKLNNISSNHFRPENMETFYINMLKNYIKLIEWQKSLGVPELNNESALQCLSYCCVNYWQEASGKPNSPQTLSQQHQICSQQYEWTALCVHSALKNWDTIDSLFIKRNFFGRNTVSFNIPLTKVISLLKESKATSIFLDKYLNHISSVDQRLELARKYKVHRTVIDCLVAKKDRQELTQYKMLLHPQSEEYFHAENALRSTVQSGK